MTENGRLVVPAPVRKLLGLEGRRAELLFQVQGREVTLSTKRRALRRAQERLAGLAPARTKLVSEQLIGDRRTEARGESGDA